VLPTTKNSNSAKAATLHENTVTLLRIKVQALLTLDNLKRPEMVASDNSALIPLTASSQPGRLFNA
jgi:hypothetical protein